MPPKNAGCGGCGQGSLLLEEVVAKYCLIPIGGLTYCLVHNDESCDSIPY